MIEISKLTFSYAGSRSPVFDSTDTVIEAGYIYGLLGKNGVGKSTLFRLIAGINAPSSGSIQTLGHTPALRLPSMLDQIYLLPETFDCPPLSIQKYARIYGQFYSRFSENDLSSYLTTFEVDPDQLLSCMSQGQRKKALIAFALSLNTSLLLMDEPTNGLDIPSKQMFRECLENASAPEKLIIISTHQVRDLEELINAVMVVNNKKIVFNDTTENILSQYHFGVVEMPDNPPLDYERPIYAMKAGPRFLGMTRRKEDEPVDKLIDLEILFGAAITGAI